MDRRTHLDEFPGSWVLHEAGLYGLDGLSFSCVSLFLHSWLYLLPVAISPTQVRTRIRSKDAWGTKDGSKWDLELRLGDLNTCMSFRGRSLYSQPYTGGFTQIALGVFVVSVTSGEVVSWNHTALLSDTGLNLQYGPEKKGSLQGSPCQTSLFSRAFC